MNSNKPILQNSLHRSKKGINYFVYLVLFLFVYLTAQGISQIESMDLGRYIEDALSTTQKPWIQIIQERFAERGDFIYFLMMSTFARLSISLILVTTIIVFFYYYLVIDTMKYVYNGKIDNQVVLCVLFAAPIVWVVSISRSLTAVVFIYLAIICFYKKKWRSSVFFLIISVLTHFSMIMWIAVIIACWFVKNVHLKTWQIFLLLTMFFVLGRLMPMQLQMMMMRVFEGEDIRYAMYSFDQATNIFSRNNDISIGDRWLPIFATVFSILLLLSNKKQGFEYWVLFVLTILLAYFLNSSILFVNRTIMLMPLFWGLNVAVIYGQSKKGKQLIQMSSWFGILFLLLYLYTNRYIYTL